MLHICLQHFTSCQSTWNQQRRVFVWQCLLTLSNTTKLIFAWFTSTRGVYLNHTQSALGQSVVSSGLKKVHSAHEIVSDQVLFVLCFQILGWVMNCEMLTCVTLQLIFACFTPCAMKHWIIGKHSPSVFAYSHSFEFCSGHVMRSNISAGDVGMSL